MKLEPYRIFQSKGFLFSTALMMAGLFVLSSPLLHEPLNPQTALLLEQGADYLEQEDYFLAYQKLSLIPKKERAYYKMAQDALKRCRRDMLPYYTLVADKLAQGYYYAEAYQLIEELATYFPEDRQLPKTITRYKEEEKSLLPYTQTVEHIFFHPLIAYPELAFDQDSLSQGYHDYFITVLEFERILASLYRNNFILIDINSLFDVTSVNGQEKLIPKHPLLPPGKKPLVISVDDVNYYPYMIANGNVHKLILDQQGHIATLTNHPNGESTMSYTNEIIPILDTFVQEHPDFSFRGAKGTLALTGYAGILGYRTHNPTAPEYPQEREAALRVVQRLKETGWSFASHSYGHPNFFKLSVERVIEDTARWQEEVGSLVGDTPIFVFPFGTHLFPGDPRADHLLASGFKMLCYVGSSSYTKVTPDYYLADRRHIDGIAFYAQTQRNNDLFISAEILDDVRLRVNGK